MLAFLSMLSVLVVFASSASAEVATESFLSGIVGIVQEGWAALQTMPPLVYFVVMALLCILPVPISPFYVAAGPLFGFGQSLLWIGGAVALNQLLAHYLAAGMLRPMLEGFLSERGHAIPKPRNPSEERLLTVLIRITPGPPYALQNWILGLAGIERRRYLIISWPIQMTHATAWVLLGQSVFEGRTGVIFAAIGLIICLGILARWVSVRLGVTRGRGERTGEP